MFSTVNGRDFIKYLLLPLANKGESSNFSELMENDAGTKVYADRAYSSEKNRQILQTLGKEDGKMHKTQRNKPLTDEQQQNNSEISKIRWIVEQGYGTLKKEA